MQRQWKQSKIWIMQNRRLWISFCSTLVWSAPECVELVRSAWNSFHYIDPQGMLTSNVSLVWSAQNVVPRCSTSVIHTECYPLVFSCCDPPWMTYLIVPLVLSNRNAIFLCSTSVIHTECYSLVFHYCDRP